MKSFKEAAKQVLSDAGKPLHYREITDRAISQGLIESGGKTPWATMNAQLSVDIKQRGEQSIFARSKPGYFTLNRISIAKVKPVKIKLKVPKVKATYTRGIINQSLNTKQKGDIAEARVAELITVYGTEALACYKPVSDDEGIDLIVKRKHSPQTILLQVKSSWGLANNSRGFNTSIQSPKVHKDSFIIFVFYDLQEGDLYEQLFVVPAKSFLDLTKNGTKKDPEQRVFTASLNSPDKSKYAEFMIEKRELANRIIEIMDKL